MEQEQQTIRGRPTRAQFQRAIRIAIVVVGALLVVILLLYVISSLFGKTVWEVLRVLILPAALVLGGIYFAERRAVIDRDIARRHAEDGELRTYFEQMGKLLLGQDTPRQVCLRESKAESDIRYLARAWTTSTLEKLAGKRRKRRLLRFLYESHLIDKDKPVVSLARARLQEANLEDAILTEADLSGAWLDKANLRHADLSDTKLIDTRLIGADLRGADLSRADLSRANLGGGEVKVNVRNGEVKAITLDGADLSNADLTDAVLSDAGLGNAYVDGKYLSGANLSNATVKAEQLMKCNSLEDATMPNGQKYEDWLKDR